MASVKHFANLDAHLVPHNLMGYSQLVSADFVNLVEHKVAVIIAKDYIFNNLVEMLHAFVS